MALLTPAVPVALVSLTCCRQQRKVGDLEEVVRKEQDEFYEEKQRIREQYETTLEEERAATQRLKEDLAGIDEAVRQCGTPCIVATPG